MRYFLLLMVVLFGLGYFSILNTMEANNIQHQKEIAKRDSIIESLQCQIEVETEYQQTFNRLLKNSHE